MEIVGRKNVKRCKVELDNIIRQSSSCRLLRKCILNKQFYCRKHGQISNKLCREGTQQYKVDANRVGHSTAKHMSVP